MKPARRIHRFNRAYITVAHDAAMAFLSFILSLYLRLGDEQMYLATGYIGYAALLFTGVAMGVFVQMRLYRGLWRYASMRDMVAIFRAVTLAILIFAVLLFAINRLDGVPRSVFFINWMLLLFMLAGPRFAYRAFKDRTLHWRMAMTDSPKVPVLLIGAGDAAEQFIRATTRGDDVPYIVVGLVDDDQAAKGRTIHHVRIYGGSANLPAIVRKLDHAGRRPQKIILADERIPGGQVRHLLEISDHLGIPLTRLPRLGEFKSSMGDAPEVRPIAVEDLLGRSQNVLDLGSMQRFVEGRVVLVTGAGGTIGSELARQLASYKPRTLVLLESGEFNLYQIERELRASHPHLNLGVVLCDVRDASHVGHVFRQWRPELVFHAAAIKHVPLSESNPCEAVLTNVFGTRNVAEACQRLGTAVMVMISTDKAVNPANVMGASKRLAESVCQALGDSSGSTQFITVRFGNVLGSTGSVVPLFQEQLAKGGPLTVTHPEMTRYFMTVREAVELVLQAAALGAGMQGRRECIFVLDMGQPVRILDLAMQMIKLAGLKPHHDIKIVYSGLRPGEKLFEELFHFSENAVKTAHESIFLASPHPVDAVLLARGLEALFAACRERRTPDALAELRKLVPEYQPALSLAS